MKIAVPRVSQIVLRTALVAAGLLAGTMSRAADPPPKFAGDDVPLPKDALARVGSPRLRHGSTVTTVRFSPDGKYLASTGFEKTIRIWEVSTGRLLFHTGYSAYKYALIAFGDNGKSLVVVDTRERNQAFFNTIITYDWQMGKESARRRLASPNQYEAPEMVALALDGKVIGYRCGRNGPYHIEDVATGKLLHSIALPEEGKYFEFPNATEKAIVLLQFDETNGAADVLEKTTGRKMTIKDEKLQFYDALAAPNGRTMVSLGFNAPKRQFRFGVWDLTTGKLVRRIDGGELWPRCLAIAPDNRRLAVGDLKGNGIQLFDLDAGKEIGHLACSESVRCLAFSPDGKTLAAGKGAGNIALWDIASGNLLPVSGDPQGSVSELRFTDGDQNLLLLGSRNEVRNWRTGWFVPDHPAPKHPFAPLSEDEKFVVKVSDEKVGSIRILNSRSEEILQTFPSSVSATPTLVSPDGRKVFARHMDHKLRIWDVRTGRELHALDIGDNSNFSLAVSRDGRRVGACFNDSERDFEKRIVVRVWDVQSGQPLFRFEPNQGFVGQIAFSPDGQNLAFGGAFPRGSDLPPDNLVVWNLTTGKKRQFESEPHTYEPNALTFSPDGRTVAGGGGDGVVRLFEVATGKERARFVGHKGQISAVTFSNSGRWLASASPDAPIFIWDVWGTEQKQDPQAKPNLDQRWQRLGDSDAAAAFRLIRDLAASSDDVVRLAERHLKREQPLDSSRINQLLSDLADGQFAAREKATTELAIVANRIEPLLRETVERTNSAEARRRLQSLLQNLETHSPDQLRQIRLLEALEAANTVVARTHFEELAKGDPKASLTEAAKAALARMPRP